MTKGAAALYAFCSGLAMTTLGGCSNDRPEVLRLLTGCYSPTSHARPSIGRVNADGTFVAGSFITQVSGYHDKGGDALLPKRKVAIIDESIPTVQIDSGYPLLLRSDPDHRTLSLPNDVGHYVTYRRQPCPLP